MDKTEYLTADELVKRWNGAVTIGTLANWRNKKIRRGPAFVKFGTNVRYPLNAVLKYEQANMINVNNNTQGEGSGTEE